MKTNTRRALLVAMLFTALVALTVSAVAADVTDTNAVAAASTNAPAFTLPPGFDQVVDLLGPKAKPVVTKIVVWLGSWTLVIGAFSGWIRRRLWNMLNTAAATSGLDDDHWLAVLFSNPFYRMISTLLRFAHLDLPSTADLDRAIAMQKEAKTGG